MSIWNSLNTFQTKLNTKELLAGNNEYRFQVGSLKNFLIGLMRQRVEGDGEGEGVIALLSAAGSIVADNLLNLLLIACYRLNFPNHQQQYLQYVLPLLPYSKRHSRGSRFWSGARYLSKWRTDGEGAREARIE